MRIEIPHWLSLWAENNFDNPKAELGGILSDIMAVFRNVIESRKEEEEEEEEDEQEEDLWSQDMRVMRTLIKGQRLWPVVEPARRCVRLKKPQVCTFCDYGAKLLTSGYLVTFTRNGEDKHLPVCKEHSELIKKIHDAILQETEEE